MYAALKNRFYTWLFRWRGPEAGAIVLVQRRVFILPTRHGLVFAVVLLVMLAGSINYSLGLGFVLTFLLGALGVNAMIHTFRNLANLRVTGGRTRPVFAGDTAFFTVHLENSGDADRYAIGLTHDRKQASFVDLMARSTTPALAAVPALRRGILRPGRLTLFTRFPLGLYYAWAYIDLDLRCIVYPRPAPPGLPMPPAATSAGAGAERGHGQEDFSGLRQYHLRRFAAPHRVEGRRARPGPAHQAVHRPCRNGAVARLGAVAAADGRGGAAVPPGTLGARRTRRGADLRLAAAWRKSWRWRREKRNATAAWRCWHSTTVNSEQ